LTGPGPGSLDVFAYPDSSTLVTNYGKSGFIVRFFY